MKCIKLVVMILVMGGFVLSFAQKAKFVQPKKSGVGIYKNSTRQLNEEAIATVGADDRLTIVDSKGNFYKVQTPDGVTGWVEKDNVTAASGKAYMFDDAEVVGYLDNPTPVYIIDADSKDATPIKLDRSFADALRQNVDRETVQRQSK